MENFFRELRAVLERIEALHRASETESVSPAVAELGDTLTIAAEALNTAYAELRQEHELLIEAQQQALMERERYFSLFEGAPDAYITTNVMGIIQDTNRAAARLLNIAAPYAIGKPLPLYVVPEERRDFRHFLVLLRDPTSVRSREWEFSVQGVYGRERVAVAATVAPVYSATGETEGYRWLLRDISRRRLMQARLAESNQLLRSLIDASPLAVISLDLEGRVRMWNKAAEAIFGWSEEEVLGQLLPTIPPDEQHRFWERFRESVEVNWREVFEATRLRKDGSTVPTRVFSAPLYDGDQQLTGTIALVAEISDEVRYRADLRAVKAQLSTVRDEERRRLALDLHDGAVQQLVGAHFQLVHLRSLALAPEAKNREAVHEGLSEVSAEIGAVVRLLRAVITDLRPPGLEEYGLVSVLETLCEQMRRTWLPPVPEIVAELPEEASSVPHPVAAVLLRVAQEGFRNARRHARASRIRLALGVGGDAVELVIEDNGEGFRLPAHLTAFAADGHFGLVGLVEQLESAGGTLEVTSTPRGDAVGEHGTTLRAVVPLNSG